jgi:hypothetical protein
MANGNGKMTTGEKVALAAGTAFAAALGAGIAALASKGSKKSNTAGPRLKTKGCGGCGR